MLEPELSARHVGFRNKVRYLVLCGNSKYKRSLWFNRANPLDKLRESEELKYRYCNHKSIETEETSLNPR